MSLGGEVLDQCSSLWGLAVPEVYKLKLSWVRESCLLAQLDNLAIQPISLALHTVVDPVDLDLKANSSEDCSSLLRPEGEGGGDKADKKIGSVQKVSSRKGRDIHA